MQRSLILWALIAVVLSAGCDYEVPLVETPDRQADAGLIGLWQRSLADGTSQSLLVLPLNDREHLVRLAAANHDALLGRAMHATVGDHELIQVEWLGTGAGNVPEDDRVYQVFAYSTDRTSLTVRQLNWRVVDRGVESTAQLVAEIEENRTLPALFRDPLQFERVEQ